MDVLVKDSEIHVPEKPLLRYHQREELRAEIADIDSSLNPQNPFRHRNSIDSAEAASRARRLQKSLDTYSPPEKLDGRVKDKLAERAKKLEEQILPGMPTQEEMRKNPAGMVGRHMRWEKGNKKKILEWKNIQQMLEPDSNDPDLSNFERLRPSGELDVFRSNAQISGHMSYGNIPQFMWDQVFKGAQPNSALNQVKQHEVVEQKVEPVVSTEKIDKRKLPKTEEQKRILAERLAAGRAKKAAKADPVEPAEGESVPFEGA